MIDYTKRTARKASASPVRVRPNVTLAEFIAAGTTTPMGVRLVGGQRVSLTQLALVKLT